MISYCIDCDLEDFGAWGGGKETLDVLIEKGVCEKVEELINASFSHPTDTDINDFLWLERDEIAEFLGYSDWDEFEEMYFCDINGVKLEISDEVHWQDEAGYDENGDMITFIIVEQNGEYFNLANEDEENPDRWAYYTELEIV